MNLSRFQFFPKNLHHHLVLLDARLLSEIRALHVDFPVITPAGEVKNLHLRLRKATFQSVDYFGLSH